MVNYRHSSGIKSIFVDSEGAKIIFIDDHNQGFVFCASTEETVSITNLPKNCKGILWDSAPTSNSFIAFDDKVAVEYYFVRYSVNGKYVVNVGETPLLSDQMPILLFDGDLCLATSSGNLSSTTLKTRINSPTVELKEQLKVLIKLRKFDDAWEVCKAIASNECWTELGLAAISDLNIAFGE